MEKKIQALKNESLANQIWHMSQYFPKEEGYNAIEMHDLLTEHKLIHPILSVIDVADQMREMYA